MGTSRSKMATENLCSTKETSGAEDKVQRRVGVIGSGTFGRAIAKRLLMSGYDVTIGSREPQSRQLSEYDPLLRDVRLETIKSCLSNCDLLFVAVHVEHFKETLSPVAGHFAGKVVVDVSNPGKESGGHGSGAEYLQSLLPDSTVVKAFNAISAYSMENDFAGASRRVFIASDDVIARACVSNLALDLGFVPVDNGNLSSARKIEEYSKEFFKDWKFPLLASSAIFSIWCLVIFNLIFLYHGGPKWDQIFLKLMNKPFYTTGITILSLTYMPGCIAAFLQIYQGTKYKPFPTWMNSWLKARKQFGIITFVLIFIHVLISIILMSPSYFGWYNSAAVVVPGNITDDLHLPHKTMMKWNGEAAGLVGILAFVLLCLLATTTLPSVSQALNWREWRFIQSHLGFTALFFAVGHVMIMAMGGWLEAGLPKILTYFSFLCIITPVIVLSMKLVLIMPCVSRYVTKIRKGWERGKDNGHANIQASEDKPEQEKFDEGNGGNGKVDVNAPADSVV